MTLEQIIKTKDLSMATHLTNKKNPQELQLIIDRLKDKQVKLKEYYYFNEIILNENDNLLIITTRHKRMVGYRYVNHLEYMASKITQYKNKIWELI